MKAFFDQFHNITMHDLNIYFDQKITPADAITFTISIMGLVNANKNQVKETTFKEI